MPNPPKMDPARGARGRGPTKLPIDGRTGRTPRWPLEGPPGDEEKKAWKELWKLPQAVMWERQRIFRTVARYCRIMVEAEQPDAAPGLHAQVTSLEDRLGLTPKAMRLLLWEIQVDEVSEKRAEREAEDVRKRFRAVG